MSFKGLNILADIEEEVEPNFSFDELSLHLNHVLNDVGVSQEIRCKYVMSANVHEILTTAKLKFMYSDLLSCYVFGSSYEGTTTRGLWSDRDALYCTEKTPVVENLNDAPEDLKSLLMLTDSTKPGYVRLQDVLFRTPLTNSNTIITPSLDRQFDEQGRLVWTHFNLKLDRYETEINGPAVTSHEFEQDYVVAFRCRSIPSFANEWLHRRRPHNWPSQAHLNRLGAYGCFLVGVGHSKSKNKDIEWRISFSLQERDIMSSLNQTQVKCYVLLKMIKKDIIENKVGKSISSYHCKTCLFHMIENTGLEFWTENNLIRALLECLKLMLLWVRDQNCPNYFIREENMFDRLNEDVLMKTRDVLQSIVSCGVDILFKLKCDQVGTLLTGSIEGKPQTDVGLNVKRRITFELYVNTMISQLATRQCYFHNPDKSIFPQDLFSRSIRALQHLEKTYFVTEHDPRDVVMILDLFIPHIRLNIAQTIGSNVLRSRNEYRFYEILNALEKELDKSRYCDTLSSKLVLATVYLQTNRLESCKMILENCASSLQEFVVATCGCNDKTIFRNKHLEEKMIAKDLTFVAFQKEFTAACMIFLPYQSNLVHPALRYEMYRSVYTPPGSRDESIDCWFDWIVVDSKVYLYFLKYLLYSATNKPVHKQEAIDNLYSLVITDKENLGHRETACNLLGWIYLQESRYNEAFYCFYLSWKIRPDHNAAKWHVVKLLHSIYRRAEKELYKDCAVKLMKKIPKLFKLVKFLRSKLGHFLINLQFVTYAIEY